MRTAKEIRMEKEANHFALCLLMPKDMFIAEYRKLKNMKEEDRVEELAKVFQVHPYHVVVRITTIPELIML